MINDAFHRLNVNILSVKCKGLQRKMNHLSTRQMKAENQAVIKYLLASRGQQAGKAWSASRVGLASKRTKGY